MGQSVARGRRTNAPLLALTSVLGVLALMLGLTGPVHAAAEYVRSEPAEGEMLAAPPTQVVVYFSEPLDGAGSTVSVLGPDGTPVSEGAPEVLTTDNQALRIGLRTGLSSGDYTVQWQTRASADGAETLGSFTFTVSSTDQSYPVTAQEPTPVTDTSVQVPAPTPVTDTTVQVPAPTPVTQIQDDTTSPLPNTSFLPSWVALVAIPVSLILVFIGFALRQRSWLTGYSDAYTYDTEND